MSGLSPAPISEASEEDEMTFEEIGKHLGMSRQMARKYFVRGMAKLRKDRRLWKMFLDANLGIRERENRERA